MIARSLTLVAVALAASIAHAQFYVDNRASTVAESRARGVADITRSRSQSAIDYSQAASGWEEARSRELDNRLKSTQTYFEMRRINREERYGTKEEKYEKKRANEEDFAKRARKGDPNELTDKQLDPLTGKISWPFELMTPEYKEYRAQLDELFEKRARHGGQVSYETYEETNKATDDLLAALKKDIRKLGSKKYVAGKQFVNALAYQVDQNNG